MFIHLLRIWYSASWSDPYTSPHLQIYPISLPPLFSLHSIATYEHSNRNKTYLVHLVLLTCIYAHHFVLGSQLEAHIWGTLSLSFSLIINCLLFLTLGNSPYSHPCCCVNWYCYYWGLVQAISYIADTEGEEEKKNSVKDVWKRMCWLDLCSSWHKL